MFGLFRKKPPANPYVKQDDPQTFRVRVKTKVHGDLVEIRFTKSAHIGVGDDGNHLFRKPIVSAEHFDKGELAVHFDRGYNVTGVEADGVEFIPVSDWS
ncbi:hypothetical protein [Deinococcus fonticola]|uniref:hypothetical protein n=1 Tax=Deinococcus fonticola TaxID=2528713 RepID=UPI001074A76B|nr:hypothetical protein [Deinococcus fonticola]